MSLQLTDIWRYPVKSCRGEQLAEAVVEPWGLAGDRRWMIVDDAGDPVTARDFPPLVLVTPRVEDGKITLAGPGLSEVTVPVPSGGELVPVNVWGHDLLATPADDDASRWLSAAMSASRFAWSTWTTRPAGPSTPSTARTATGCRSPTATRCC